MNDNRYIEIFDKCYNRLNQQGREVSKVVLRPSGFKKFFLPKDKEFKELVERPSIDCDISDCKHWLDDFIQDDFRQSSGTDINITRSYRQLWEFCQFIRYAEKVIFYKNNIDSEMYVDTKIDDVDKREFLLNGDEVKIYFHLESKRDDLLNTAYNIINLKVMREYGKKMINEYTIINEQVKLNSIGDNILIVTVNNILYDATLNTFNAIMEKLFEFFKERIRWETEHIIS